MESKIAISSNIPETYNGKYVLITGATGFLGKVLVEKLLYSCPDIGKIYILIRDRRGTPAKERFNKFISNSIFDRIRTRNPKILEKLNLIEGDCLHSDLGIKNPEEMKIHIIFHVVATVKFNEKLETAIDVNVNGTIRILELAKKMSDLESFVYISTAYSIPYKSHVEEKVQQFDLIGNFSSHIVQNELKLTESQLNSLSVNIGAEKLYPNTYTITKHMAEQVVYDFSKELSGIDVIIVRPSIITAAAYEPIIGWIDSFNGPSAMMVEISRGTIKSVIGNGNVIADLIPVDIVTNTIIVKFGRLIDKYAIQAPTKHVLMYPGFKFRPKNLLHRTIVQLYHFLPIFILGIILKLLGKSNNMMRIARIIDAGIEANSYFTSREWDYETNNLKDLANKLENSLSRHDFNCDAKCYDWDTYVRGYMLGTRQFLLRDPIETLPSARRRLFCIFLMTNCLKLAFLYLLWNIGYNFILSIEQI
uniref:Fatty acyl-CoA reductase n=1 Tax=Culicoides sonorensis TaxID=179676 RepID=A0A336M135_CULSO